MINSCLRTIPLAPLGAAFLALAASPAPAAEPARYSLTAGMDYSSGGYGANSDTDIWYVPVRFKYERGPSTVKLTVPYLRITAPAGGTVIGYDSEGRPIYSGGTGGRSTEEGLGDLMLAYTYSLFEQPRGNFLVDLGAKVKFATADADKGLGSGKNDYGAFTDVYYLAGATTPFATVGYRSLGKPAGLELRNVWQTTLGLAYKLSDRNSTGAMWDWRQSSAQGGTGMSELTAYWAHKTAGGLKLQAYGVAGLSNASPDYGLGLLVTVASK
ncbi:MAG: hypothetical protein PHR30_08970 [Gallionellaceae bacterium]|nr:hypothetical protein [Gallionellaceae bacterium]